MALIRIQRLAELDLALHGKRFILTEFSAGVILPAALGAYTLFIGHSSFETLLGVYLILLGLNYLPLLIYAFARSRRTIEGIEYSESMPNLKQEIKTYGVQQAIILIPFAVPAIAFIQELTKET